VGVVWVVGDYPVFRFSESAIWCVVGHRDAQRHPIFFFFGFWRLVLVQLRLFFLLLHCLLDLDCAGSYLFFDHYVFS